MDKIVNCSFVIVVSCLLNAFCIAAPVNCGSPTDTFRIGLHYSDPKSPSPLGPSSQGTDVKNWQCFLQTKGFGLTEDNTDHVRHDTAHKPYPRPDGIFDRKTEEATMQFQAMSRNRGRPIAITGTVTYATFWKAVSAGMRNYKILPPNRTLRLSFQALAAGQFRYPMSLGCADSTGWTDVAAWQTFLVSVGELTMNPVTGLFGSTTQMATKQFQIDTGVNSGSGVVDKPTELKAVTYGFSGYTLVNTQCN